MASEENQRLLNMLMIVVAAAVIVGLLYWWSNTENSNAGNGASIPATSISDNPVVTLSPEEIAARQKQLAAPNPVQ
jgi:hypothetical protein